jgi:hypothetical protein
MSGEKNPLPLSGIKLLIVKPFQISIKRKSKAIPVTGHGGP